LEGPTSRGDLGVDRLLLEQKERRLNINTIRYLGYYSTDIQK
jgi:hypothetical protein